MDNIHSHISKFAVLSRAWYDRGVNFHVTPDPYAADRLLFHDFRRFRLDAKKGRGYEALTECCQLADTLGATLYLFISKITAHKLLPYYEKVGFVAIPNDMFMSRIYMKREVHPR